MRLLSDCILNTNLIFSSFNLANFAYFELKNTSGGVLDGELLYTKILEVNLFAFAYRLFHEDFSPTDEPVDWREIFTKQSVGKCKQINS